MPPVHLHIRIDFLKVVIRISIHKVAVNHLTFYGNFVLFQATIVFMVIERHKTLLLFQRGKKNQLELYKMSSS